ncbi:MAG: efflux RND transporter periplasmic adaptor subunit [Flavobacteriaceae bacterium]|nr:efflux RND transporter periplasmic adaptor subunit [Flavobacteriaceae bacterium]
MKNIKISITFLFMVLLISSCGNTAKGEKDKHNENSENNHDDHDDHEENTVSLTEQQMEAISLKLVTIENKKMNISVKASGELEVSPQDKADVNSIIGGIVKNIYVIEGDAVRKGKILARIEHPDIVQMQQDYLNNLNSLQFLEKEYNRRKILYEEKVGSGKEFQRITAEYRNSKTNLAAQKMKLSMLGLNISSIESGNLSSSIHIVSPLNGKVGKVEINIGAYAEPLTKLIEIINNDELHADVMVFEKDISKIKVGQTLNFTTSSLKGREFSGEIHAISPVFEVNPKAIHVHAEIKNKNKILIPGMYIQGQIITNSVLTDVLPEKSIVTKDEKSYIFIKIKNEEHAHDENGNHKDEGNHNDSKMIFKMIEIITGISNNGFTVIKLLKELPKNALIVENGAYFLLAELHKSEAEHSH